MPNKRDVIINPFVSEYLYDNIVNATLEQRRFLNGKFLRVARSPRRARAWVITSTLEEKALMFAKLGISFAWVFNLDKGKISELKEGMKGASNVQLIDKMLAERYFAITDKQIMLYAGLMASNAHSETWILNRQFLQAAYRVKEWRQQYGNEALADSKDASPASRNMANLMLNTILFSKYALGAFDVNESELAVLLHMFSKEKEFVHIDDLKLKFNGAYRNFKLVKAINVLVKAKYIEKGEGQWVKQYRVTGWGVDIALRFEKKVFSLENY